VLTTSIIRAIAMTSVNFYHTTRRNIPEDSHLQTRRREKQKPHQMTAIDTFTRLRTSNISELSYVDDLQTAAV
jgi:hypothetical protein